MDFKAKSSDGEKAANFISDLYMRKTEKSYMCANLIKRLQNTKTDRHKGKIHNRSWRL